MQLIHKMTHSIKYELRNGFKTYFDMSYYSWGGIGTVYGSVFYANTPISYNHDKFWVLTRI